MPMRSQPAEIVLADALVTAGRGAEAGRRVREATARAVVGTRLRAELLDAQARALAASADYGAAYRVQREALLERDRSTSDRARVRLGLMQARFHDALAQLTGGGAHDFNNLMTVVEQSAGLLRSRESVQRDPLALRLVEESRGAARTGAQITRQLRAFARRQPLEPQTLLLDYYLLGIRDLLARTLGDRLRLEVEVESPAPAVRADRGQLTASLINLLANARDATPDGGLVRIRARRGTTRPGRSRSP